MKAAATQREALAALRESAKDGDTASVLYRGVVLMYPSAEVRSLSVRALRAKVLESIKTRGIRFAKGRRPLGTPVVAVGLTLAEDQVEALDRRAEEQATSRSDIARREGVPPSAFAEETAK